MTDKIETAADVHERYMDAKQRIHDRIQEGRLPRIKETMPLQGYSPRIRVETTHVVPAFEPEAPGRSNRKILLKDK